MTDTAASAPTSTSAAPQRRLSDLFGNMEIIVVVMLGIVSVVTAYASFQAALYDSQMAGAYTKGGNASTAAESLYLEANQTYIQDVQLVSTLTQLGIDTESTDAAIAAGANAKFDEIYFQSVSEDLDAAITWADAENEADPETFTSPFDNEDYMNTLFSPYAESQEEAEKLVAEGDTYNTLSDRLTLNTVLMAISLFLLGVAAVVKKRRSQIALTAIGTVIFLVAGGLTLAIPYVSI